MQDAPQPDVTIITICFRNPDEVEQTLRSIALLAAHGMESIVVDGSPDDSCRAVIAAFPFARHLHGPDRGKYDALNKGVAAALGRTIIFMNSGDHFHNPNKFIALIEQHRGRLGDHIIYGDCIKIIAGQEIAVPAPTIDPVTLRTGVLPSHQSIVMPADWLRTHPFDDQLDFAADTKLLKRAFLELRSIYVAAPIAIFAFGGISASPGRWKKLVQQHRELVAVHELTRTEAIRLALFLVRRKFAHLVIGEAGLQKVQAARLRARLRRDTPA